MSSTSENAGVGRVDAARLTLPLHQPALRELSDRPSPHLGGALRMHPVTKAEWQGWQGFSVRRALSNCPTLQTLRRPCQ